MAKKKTIPQDKSIYIMIALFVVLASIVTAAMIHG